jgi:hypothetical protein
MSKKPTATRVGELPPINFRTATDERIDELRDARAAQQRRHIALDQVLTRGLQPDSTVKELRARQLIDGEDAQPPVPSAAAEHAELVREIEATDRALELLARRSLEEAGDRQRALVAARMPSWVDLLRAKARTVAILQGQNRASLALAAELRGPGGPASLPLVEHVLLGPGDKTRHQDFGRDYLSAMLRAGHVTAAELEQWRTEDVAR